MTKFYLLKSIALILFVSLTSLAFGRILVTIPAVVPVVPTISGFSPASGPVGTAVIVTGANFNATTSGNIVFFGATMATVTQASETSLTVIVPVGATYQAISVLNTSTLLTGYSAKPFITTFSPNNSTILKEDFFGQLDIVSKSTSTAEYMTIADLDGDGKIDLVLANSDSNGSYVALFRNISTGGPITASSFASRVDLAVGGTPTSILAKDLTGDGKPEIIVLEATGTISGNVSIYRNTSTNGVLSFDTKFDINILNGVSVSVGDLDSDGKPDLVVSNRKAFTVYSLRNTSSDNVLSFAAATASIVLTGAGPENTSVGDLDGDGKPDLVLVSRAAGLSAAYRNISTIGSIAFSTANPFPAVTGDKQESSAIGDLNDDGKPDVVITDSKTNLISVFQNTSTSGTISFASKVAFATDNKVKWVGLTDIDGDGKPDINTVAINGGGVLSVFRNTHSGGAITTSSFAAKSIINNFIQDLSIGDIDGDGRPDFAGTNLKIMSVIKYNPFRTRIISSLRGTTLSNIDSAIKVDAVTSATTYRFRVKEGVNEQTFESTTHFFKLTQLATFAYNTMYRIDVQVLAGGVWGDYENAYSVTTPVASSKVNASYCGTTLSAIDTGISADNVPLATSYRFRVSENGNIQTIDVPTNSFKLTQLGVYASNTEYTIDVQVKIAGVWSAYGAACNVITPVPANQISPSLRGTTLTSIDAEIRADLIPLATGYRFRVTHEDDVQIIDVETNFFKLTQLANFAYNTTYSIDLQVKMGQATSIYGEVFEISTPAALSQISDSFRGITMANIDSAIGADTVLLATGYRFKVTDGSVVQTFDAQKNSFRLKQLTAYSYNTTYSIAVAVKTGGVWSNYGSAYNVTTPAPSTQIEESFRGKTLSNIDSAVSADTLTLATAYRFRVTHGVDVQTYDALTNSFRLNQLATYAYSTTYSVAVAVQTNNTWYSYGTAYDVTTPAPITQISESFRGKTLAHIDSVISADPFNSATAYRFRVIQGSNVQTFDASTNSFKLTQLANYADNTTYSIDVAVKAGGVWYTYGSAFNISTPAPFTQISESFRGKTLAHIDSAITADPLTLATAYRFRVTQGSDVQSFDSQTNSLRLSHLANYAYNTVYSLEVAVKTGGTWYSYGPAYSVTTPAPSTQISEAFRGKTIANIDSVISADSIHSASAYRFRTSLAGRQQTFDAQFNHFKLTQMPSFAYNSIYSVDVAVKTGGTWSSFGPAYEVTSPAPSTQVSESFRGITLSNIDSAISADPVPLATSYRFRVTQEGNEQTVDVETNSFKITQLDDYAYNTEYNLDVAVEVGGNMSAFGMTSFIATPVPATKISDAYCGKTLPEIDGTIIYIDNVPLATNYRIRLTQNSTVQILETPFNHFRITHFTNYAYNTTYTIDVQVQVDGNWSDYGAVCTVTTPNVPLTQVAAVYSGKTLTDMVGSMHADNVSLATVYRFKITNGSNTEVLESNTRLLALSKLSFYAYNTTYNIQVSSFVYGVWTAYGAVSNVTTAPYIIKLSDAVCGKTLTDINQVINIDYVPLASNYRIRLTQNGTQQTIVTTRSDFRLTHFTTFDYNTTYTLDAQAELNGVWSNYGTACTIVTPSIPTTQVSGQYCGKTLASMEGLLYADAVSLATNYRFKITSGSNEEILESTTNLLQLSKLSFYAYNATYSIQVSSFVHGAWNAYGAVCNVTTGTLEVTISDSFCGKTLPELDGTIIYINKAPMATNYRIRMTQNGTEQTIVTTRNDFRLTHFANYDYNKTYKLAVQVEINGIWSDYGPECTVNTPSIPLTQLSSGFCGKVLTTSDGQIRVDYVPLSTFYRFKISQGGTEEILESNTNLLLLNKLSDYSYNTTYTISVSSNVHGTWTDYGPACAVTTALPLSTADLTALDINHGTLVPAFDPAIFDYTVFVSNVTDSIRLRPRAANAGKIKINGIAVSSGRSSKTIALKTGANTVITEIIAQDKVLSRTYKINVIRLRADQILPDQSGDASVNNSITQVVVVSSTQPVAVTMPDRAGSATIDYSNILDHGAGVIPQTTAITSFARLDIPAATTITASGSAWDGILTIPQITNYDIPSVTGQIIRTGLIIEVGSPITSLSFDKAVRLSLIGQAGMRVARVHDQIYTEVLLTGATDSQAEGDALPADGTFKIDNGADMVLWTKVFSKYITFSQTKDINVALAEADRNELTADVIKGSNTAITNTTVPLNLPALGSFGSSISWVSSNPAVVSADGQTIVRPPFGSGTIAVTLTATITKGLIILTKSFVINVAELGNQEPTLAEADRNELTADVIKGSNTAITNITAPLNLPSLGEFGSSISWVSSNPAVVSADGRTIVRPPLGSGTIAVTLTATITKGLIILTKSFVINVAELANQAPTLAAFSNQAICLTTTTQAIPLTGLSAGPESTQTTTQTVSTDKPEMFSALAIINGVLNYTLTANATGTAIITVVVKDNGGTSNGGIDIFTQTFTITVNPLPAMVIASDMGAEISKGRTALLYVPAVSGTTYSWANAAGIVAGQNSSILKVRPAATDTYILTTTNSTGCSSVQGFTLTVLEDYLAIEVNNLLTPNGDGNNDYLVIQNLDMYPANTLKIFNSAGQQVYQQANYKNDWDGTYNGSPLAGATYFYFIDFGPALGKVKGFVSIVR